MKTGGVTLLVASFGFGCYCAYYLLPRVDGYQEYRLYAIALFEMDVAL